ncbi:Na+/H+ antiporter NhaC [Thalassotalea insulae]|uniref:Na+/H+ antiporter NhaC n=1 Tax=Thalassotalea insulae TaxID=2056778 RepID=A0ABQ6GWT9_9GAMM|nr:Na+/H+ antiporter NhaC family protein [Thalassotalea insulae]GLX80400.1 Na+/H+ antiporter NhaC [Thalassotalea insulae]
MVKDKRRQLIDSVVTISILVLTIGYGLIVRPVVWQQPQLPLEIIFLLSAIASISYLLAIGHQWSQILERITAKLAQALPTLLILFAIGLLIASWMIAGTIPYLVYYGLTIISAEHIYLVAFITPVFFSLCTGTSWGSIATIGLVLISVANVINADLAITTGAIVGGAYFGDKLSPLSDTTNIAAIAVNIDVYQHIESMLVTTVPSAVLACLGFVLLDVIYPANIINIASSDLRTVDILTQTLNGIEQLFSLNILLLIPPVIVLIGAIRKVAALPTLILSSIAACILALVFQEVTLSAVFQTLYQGFDINMLTNSSTQLPDPLDGLFNRGGLYALNTPIIIVILVFIYLGALDCINAIPTVINHVLDKISSQAALISTTLIASGVVNALTSSQYANSFVVGESFKTKYDQCKLPRKVLSRSLEDTGTMIESLIPWSTTSVFVYASLNVAIQDYWRWQLLSLINIAIAFLFAWCGIGYFQQTTKKDELPNG